MKVDLCPMCKVAMEPKERHPLLSWPDRVVVRFECQKCGHESLQSRWDDQARSWWQRLWGRK